jgi:HNH endonuclease
VAYGIDIHDLGRRDAWTCWVCGGAVDPDSPPGSPHAPSVDHVIPRARGGTNDPGNLRLAHRRCNGQRGSRLPELDWPDHLRVYEPAPLWPVLQRARKRPGEWEVVGVVGNDVAGAAQEWLRETATDIARGDWETRLQAVGTQLSMLALRLNRSAA